MRTMADDLGDELQARSAARRGATAVSGDDGPGAELVGTYVMFMRPTLHGQARTRGKVTRVVNGKYEVKVAEGGYYMLDRSELVGDQAMDGDGGMGS